MTLILESALFGVTVAGLAWIATKFFNPTPGLTKEWS